MFLVFWLLSFNAFSAETSGTGFSGMFAAIEQFFADIYYFITEVIPQKIFDFFIYIKLYFAYHYALYVYETLKYSHNFALTVLSDLNITDVINVALDNLPSDLRSAATEMRVFDALTLLTEALITRFVFTIAIR